VEQERKAIFQLHLQRLAMAGYPRNLPSLYALDGPELGIENVDLGDLGTND
jgi:hypothetical protein